MGNNVRDCFSNEPLKKNLILFLTNFTKYMAVFTFSNRRSMTSLRYTSTDITPVKECFWSNDGKGQDSRWGVLDDGTVNYG